LVFSTLLACLRIGKPNTGLLAVVRDAAEQEFREALSPIENLEWRAQLTLGPADEKVANEARAADLVIAPLDNHYRLLTPSGQAEVGALRRLANVVAWLARHGVEAHGSTALAVGTKAQQLAAVAKDVGADLIVAGAFGHSRLREWAFGGVTRNLLLSADTCVLASH
jgi:nucleotide-binding universal stress UspA family protein